MDKGDYWVMSILKKAGIFFKVVFWGFLIVFTTYFIYFSSIEHEKFVKKQLQFEAPFQKIIVSAVDLLKKAAPHKYREDFSDIPVIDQKTLVLRVQSDSDGLWFDDMNNLVPEKLGVKRPEDVKNILFLNWRTEEYIKYSHQGSSYIQRCYFVLIDLSKRTILYRGVVTGDKPNPPETSTGPRPYQKIKKIMSMLFGK